MERGEWDDDARYPVAPLPAHERPWRHPSEVAAAEWVATEPPLVIGRGLFAATATVGVLLALAVVWAMIPADRQPGSVIGAPEFMSITTVAALPPTAVTNAAVHVTELLSASAVPTTVATTAVPVTAAAVPASEEVPPATFAVQSSSGGSAAVAIGIDLGGAAMLVTSADAVAKATTVAVVRPDGGSATARVVSVDTGTGLALLSTVVDQGYTYRVAEGTNPGESLTLYDDQPRSFVVGGDGSLTDAGPTISRSGVPVMNQYGEVVALCMSGPGGEVSVTALGADLLTRGLVRQSGADILGFTLADGPGLVVAEVGADGPMHDVGLLAGDRLVAIDDVAIATRDDFDRAMLGYQPGDIVGVSVARTPGLGLTFGVHLADEPSTTTSTVLVTTLAGPAVSAGRAPG